mgnify:CR=1 FL=1
MEHAADPSRGNYDDPLATPTYIIGIVGTVILIATVFLVQTLSHDTVESFGEKAAVHDYLEIQKLRTAQQAQLEGHTWTFPEEDRVSVPISEGISHVLDTYGPNE